ncbi:hypothetical protein lerEdw1_019442 [Lerista edwardsae]|nr:hypothetical protein lerEdw1_019442 [Lerista edwardsae]
MAAPVLLPCLLGHLGGLLASAAAAVPGSTAARVEVLLQAPLPSEEPQKLEGGGGGGYTLQGALLGRPGLERDREAQEEEEEEKKPPSQQQQQPPKEEEIRGSLVLVGDTDPKVEDDEGWIAVVPLSEEQAEILRGSKEESFTAAVVSKMKRALVLGASALLILALNQNALRELDVSQVLSKPVIVIQTSENVTRLLGALLRRGLRATAKITYQAVLLENVVNQQFFPRWGVTLTLWSTCGLSRGGLYGEWQGVICTGENGSRVQLDLKQHIAQRLSALKTRRYHPGKAARAWAHDIDSCAICLDRFHKNQCLRVLPCLHEFHRDCVDPWLLLQQTCPLCKDNVLGLTLGVTLAQKRPWATQAPSRNGGLLAGCQNRRKQGQENLWTFSILRETAVKTASDSLKDGLPAVPGKEEHAGGCEQRVRGPLSCPGGRGESTLDFLEMGSVVRVDLFVCSSVLGSSGASLPGTRLHLPFWCIDPERPAAWLWSG